MHGDDDGPFRRVETERCGKDGKESGPTRVSHLVREQIIQTIRRLIHRSQSTRATAARDAWVSYVGKVGEACTALRVHLGLSRTDPRVEPRTVGECWAPAIPKATNLYSRPSAVARAQTQGRWPMRNAWRALTIAAMATAMVTGAPRQAAADPVDTAKWVTSGSYFTQGGQDFFSFVSPAFEFDETSGATPDKTFPSSCSTCTAGDTVNLSFRNPPLDADDVYAQTVLGSGHGHTLNDPDALWISGATSSSWPRRWNFRM